MRALAMLTALAIGTIGCGNDEEEAPPVPVAPQPGAAPTGAGQGGGPEQPGTTPTAEPTSSIETAAPEPATGCPAGEVAAQLDRPGTVHRREIRGDETLDLAGSPHRFPRGFHVEEGATLTVEACALVLMGNNRDATIAAGAGLVTAGEEGRPVRFDSESAQPAKGAWREITFAATALPQSRLVHTIIEDAGGGGHQAAIYVSGEYALKVQHLTIRHSKVHGVRLHNDARFTDDSTALTITQSGSDDPYSAPVWFYSASQVRTLPEGTYTENATDEIYVDRAEVRTSGSWRNPGIRYRLSRGLKVGADGGAVLTIAAGTTLAFDQNTALEVGVSADGGLILDGGAPETPILLTSARPYPAAGDWNGIRLGQYRSDAAIRLDQVRIEYAGSEGSYDPTTRRSCRDNGRTAILIEDHDLGDRIKHTTVRELPEDATAILVGFRGDATDYTASELENVFSDAGTECHQNAQPEGDCPDPTCL